MGKSTISMAIFNSYVSLPEGTSKEIPGTKMTNLVPVEMIVDIHYNPIRCLGAITKHPDTPGFV